MSIRLFNPSGGFIDLNAGGDGTAANVFTLPAETGTLLTTATTSGISASALSTGTLATARLPAGSVLQVVSTAYSTETAFTSTSFVATSVSVSITPSSASSKILLLSTMSVQSGASGIVTYTIYRGASNLGNATFGFGRWYVPESDTTASMVYLDSPATTSATTYAVYVKTGASTAYYSLGNAPSSIVAMEIAA
jgi:hypothetical protein